MAKTAHANRKATQEELHRARKQINRIALEQMQIIEKLRAELKATQEELHRARWSEFVGASRPTVVPGAVVSREILAKCWLFTYNDAGE